MSEPRPWLRDRQSNRLRCIENMQASGRGVELLGTFKFQVVRESTLVQSHHGIEIVLKPSAHLMLESQFA
jgi:hypothetical protein